jgi:FAD binding domain/Berberine and berberine like
MSNTQSRRDVLAGGASIAAASLALTPSTRAEPGSSATETAFNTRRETFVLGARKSDWDALRRRLRGRLLLPTDGRLYEDGRKVFNARIDSHPLAVVSCLGADDVVTCVKFCAANGIRVTCRCGGHGALGYAVRDGQMVIDLSALQSISFDARNKTVTVGGGAFWGQVDLATCPRGYASTGGGCPQVGVGGLAQGGGLGPLARSCGLTIDNLVEADIVTAQGKHLARVSEDNEPELFWALRGGGGGNFGAITSFTFRLHPIEPVFTAGTLRYSWAATRKLLQFFRDWMRSKGDDRLTLMPVLVFNQEESPSSLLSVFYNGPWQSGAQYLSKVLRDFGAPDSLSQSLGLTTLPSFTAAEASYAWPGTAQIWKSGFLKNDFPDAAIDTIMESFEKAPGPVNLRAGNDPTELKPPNLTFAFIEPLGGRIRDKGSSETAFFWRDSLFSFTFIGVYPPSDTSLAEKMQSWTTGFRSALKPYYSDGVYVNYLQDDLPNWKYAYYGDNFHRLRAVKRAYDRDHLFCFPQDLLQS